MFEGLVSQLLLGYLGRYIKDIQKEQLKITLWNEEVLLENVELILEAFDYLQLPFALKQGRVGRLSIKIPWKKLGWDPIIIILEDVFICACQRDDQEWSLDAIERRELAGKKAKLAAAELAKLSKRVCDNQAGKSFISYITAKILDGIQVSIRNVHVLYRDVQNDSAHIAFGLRFSALTIMKQNPVGSFNGKVRGGQVNKTVEILGLEIYCSTSQGTLSLIAIDDAADSKLGGDARLEGNKNDYILAPFDVSMTLLVNRSGKLENDAPQYSINAELTSLVMSLDEVQLQQILSLCDYLCTSRLREKYGRYRPSSNLLSRKVEGWQKMWWHYAQASVLSDVRKKLKRTSWTYFGQRLSCRRKYVNLYKTKLDFLRQEKPIDEHILRELEKIEKESGIDEILNYRSTAESELQDFLLTSSTSTMGTSSANATVEKLPNDERSSSRSRGWLNWLSLGMLGAGGTDDSGEFSGVVSDEVIKDIYEATKFHPVLLSNVDAAAADEIYLSAVKFSIHQISATLRRTELDREIADLVFNGVTIKSKLCEESATIIASVNSVEMVYPCSKKFILLVGRPLLKENVVAHEQPSVSAQVNVSPSSQEAELSIKVMLEPLEVTCDPDIFLNFMEFYNMFKSFDFHHKRVLLSLNGIENVKSRLLSKAEYILSSHKKVSWDVSFNNIIISLPWTNADLEPCSMVLESGSLFFTSKHDLSSLASNNEDQSYNLKGFLSSISTISIPMGVQLHDLYDHFEIKLNDFEVKILMPSSLQAISVLEKFSATVTLASCIIPDELILKQLEVYFSVLSLHAHFSPLIYGSVIGLIAHFKILQSKSEPVSLNSLGYLNIMSNGTTSTNNFCFSISANLESVNVHVNLENDGANSSVLMLSQRELDIRYGLTEFEECMVSLKALNISTYSLGGDRESHNLCSSYKLLDTSSGHQHDQQFGLGNKIDNCGDSGTSIDECFLLHYEASRSVDLVRHKCTVFLNDVELHCYPYIFGLLVGFYDKISGYGTSSVGDNLVSPIVDVQNPVPVSSFGFQRFGFSNYFETGSSEWASIPLNNFPFVTIKNSGSLGILESSLFYAIPGWRKNFNLRDRNIKRPKFSMKKGSRSYNAPALKESNSFLLHLNLGGTKIHFHDSKCIVGSITMPITKFSLSIHGDYLDVLCSSEGLILSSSWWTKNFHEFLWGPSLPNLSPILNIRMTKGNAESIGSHSELSISIQHVCCILPPEYLAIVIGYFSLPDWGLNANKQPVFGKHKHINREPESDFLFKLEIVDSTLILPVKSNGSQFLNLDIQQLYCSFMDKSCSGEVLRDIPPECLVQAHEVADKSCSLNVFGRDLSLSLLLFKDDAHDLLMFGQDSAPGNITFIAPLSVDVWVRIPWESETLNGCSPAPMCVMVRVCNCQLIAEDGYIFSGFEALIDVIFQFSSIDEESKCFTSDVLQFLHSKRSLRESRAVPSKASNMMFTEARCFVNSLSIKFCCLKDPSISFEPVAKADMQFVFSASLRNEIPLRWDICFSSLSLYSLPNCLMLVHCISASPNSSVLDMHFSRLDQGENELDFALASLNIWLHLFKWAEVIDLFNYYAGQLAEPSMQDSSSDVIASGPLDPLIEDKAPLDRRKNVAVSVSKYSVPSLSMSSYFVSQTMKQNAILNMKSDNIAITFHIPVWVSGESFSKIRESAIQEERPLSSLSAIVEGEHSKFIEVTLQSRNNVLIINGSDIKVKSCLEQMSGSLQICEDKSVHSWPFFHLFQVNVEAEICNNPMEPVHVKTVVQCDNLDVWLSRQVFHFWHGTGFKIPEAGSSQFTFSHVYFEVQLRKLSLLLTDERWSCNGPLLEILTRNLRLQASITEENMDGSITGDLQVNYNNIHKVLWEPFVEPWMFQIDMIRSHRKSSVLNSFITTDINLKSTAQLNLNFTESLVEALFRVIEMIKDAWGLIGLNDLPESNRFLNRQIGENECIGRYVPYILQNLTSLPLVFHVYQNLVNADDSDVPAMNDGKFVQPGHSVPIYINETPEEQMLRFRPVHSSDRLNEKQSHGVAHHFITIQLDGTSVPSNPLSMDLVGLTYFEVDFSKASNKTEINTIGSSSKYNKIIEENHERDANSGFVVPVVFDVSIQRYSKLVRLYSTVILMNATSKALELRFDIPFGVSPKILDPIYPGQEFPLPLHLAESGRIRWRPLGSTYLWSEAYKLSDILSQENRIAFLRSFVCYPSHPSNDPFRCCLSVQDVCLPSFGRAKKGSYLHTKDTVKRSVESGSQILHNQDKSKKRLIHQITLSTPLIVNNYLPEAASLTIESGGVTRSALLSEVETSFFHIDSSQDLGMVFHMHGFKPSVMKFPRTETFTAMAKFSGTKFSLSETMILDPDLSNGPTYLTVEKVMDAFSGARELCIFVPFLLYNCTGFSLIVSDSANEMKGNDCTIPSCYTLVEREVHVGRKDGLSLLSSDMDASTTTPVIASLRNSSSKEHIISTRKNVDTDSQRFQSKPMISSGSSTIIHEQSDKLDSGKVKACMYSPNPNPSESETMVRVRRSECLVENTLNSSWSSPFSLVPPSGSCSVLVPQPSTNAAFILSVTSSAVDGPFAGRTRAITFQPRYVISNACSKDLCYKQKGTDFVSYLGVGQHSHLHWTDTSRDLLVSICFNGPGWQWSGSFLPDHLGDTQVKMRNYVSGALNMIRVEVQNADISIRDEKIIGSPHGNSGTNLILLSDDDTGFMPYRIDNFSKERLRIYQQRCETFETIVHSYTSCPYAWDEPCYPHRLTVEVPGERVVGSYALDNVKEYMPICLPSTSEKPERTLVVSVHAEGAMKVLSIMDSSYHILKDMKVPSVRQFREKRKHDQELEAVLDYKEKISVNISFIGISLISSYPQELLFACAKNTRIDLLQSLDHQKFSFQISSLQIDNQLHTTPYPVVLSFDHEYRSNPAGQIRTNDNSTMIQSESVMQVASDSSFEPVFCLAAAKWRNKDISLVSFEYISLRVADFRLELEQEVILSLLEFFRTVSSRFQSRVMPSMDSTWYPLIYDMEFVKKFSADDRSYDYGKENGGQHQSIKFPLLTGNHKSNSSLPSIVPIGAPWQQIYLLAGKQRKIYVEVFDLAPIKLTLSFSSTPWMLRNGILTSGESLIHRGLMALADIEGAQIYLKQLTIMHHMASLESIEEILTRHYTRQLLHEMYKVFGSAGVIGNPVGFIRSVGLGIKDFLSAPARSVLQSPTGLITGMAQGTTSLLSSTVYAISDAATQFSKAAHKGIVAFTFDDQAAGIMEKQQKSVASHSKGVINELLEGLTGLLQSPIKGAEKHGLPGVLSGVALGLTGLVARPAASILEVTGKTAQSIRNRSRLYQMGARRLRVRLPRPLSRELPLMPYSWEEAVGASVLADADDELRLKEEVLITCKALKQDGKFFIITERLILIVSCSSLVGLGKPEFQGVPATPEWVIEAEIGLESVIHADTDDAVIHIVGSSSETMLGQTHQPQRKSTGMRTKQWNNPPTPLPFFQTSLEFVCKEDAEELLQILLSAIEQGKERGWGSGYLLHQSNLK